MSFKNQNKYSTIDVSNQNQKMTYILARMVHVKYIFRTFQNSHNCKLWNHSYCGGGGDHCSWIVRICRFVGPSFFCITMQDTSIINIANCWCKRKFMGKCNPRNPRTLIYHEH